MKSTEIVRQIDDLGRIVLPIELRKALHIDKHDMLEIFVDGQYIIIEKYEPKCVFCGSADEIESWKGKNICNNCKADLKNK